MEKDADLRCGRYQAGPPGGGDVHKALLSETRYARNRVFDTLHLRLELRVDFGRRSVEGRCVTQLRAFPPGASFLPFDAAGMKILGARVDGIPARHSHDGKALKVRCPRRLKGGEEASVEIRYRVARPEVGLHFVPPGAAGNRFFQLWSQGQPEESHYWFPCHDAPHQKAVTEVVATVPRGYAAVSNGTLVEKRRARGGDAYHWRMETPHALYLVSLAVGRFGEVQERCGHAQLSIHCERGREEDARRGLGKTAKAMAFFSESLGVPYPYPRYAQVCVARFPGGMENTTATTLTDACLIDRRAALDSDVDALMAHELAHQWFGDLVTCRDWAHAWLNEGFATYFESLFTLHDKGQDEFDYELHQNLGAYLQEGRERYSRPIVCKRYADPWVLFDRHLYEKGAWVLHMLRRELGDALWWKALGRYLSKHRNGSVETEDLILAVEQATGRNLRAFFDQWVYRAGHPQLKARYRWMSKGKKAELAVLQTQPVSEDAPPFRVELALRFQGGGWTRDFTRALKRKEHRWEFRLPGEPLSVEIDPEHCLLKQLELRKPLSMWLRQLRRSPRALSRAHAARAVARWGGPEAVQALAQALGREPFWGAAAEMASALGSLRTRAAFDALRPFLKARHPKLRRAVLQALGEFHAPELPALLRSSLLREPSVHARGEAARALGRLQDGRWLPLLRGQLRKPSYRDAIRGGALQGLAALRDLRALPDLLRAAAPGASYPGRAHAIGALPAFVSLSGRVVDSLRSWTGDPDERVALSAIAALGRCEDESAIPLLDDLRENSPNSRVRTYAAEAAARVRAGFEKGPGKR